MKKIIVLITFLITGLFIANAGTDTISAQASDQYRLFPKGSPPAEVIDYVNLMQESKDTKLAAITLQGQINSGQMSHVYLSLSDAANKHKYWMASANDELWLSWLKQKGYVRKTNKLTIEEYFRKYSNSYEKVIVYDNQLPASINVATMIASMEKGIVTAPADVEKYRKGKEVVDLQGRWKSEIEAYEWAFKNLWPGMNHEILAGVSPISHPHNIRDYLIRNKVFTFFITGGGRKGRVKSDIEREKSKEFVEKLFSAAGVNIPLVGYFFSVGEYGDVGLAGMYGKFTIAFVWPSSLSLISGIEVDFKDLVVKYRERRSKPEIKLDKKKVYISFDVVDSGDSPGYWYTHQRGVWNDPNRGKVPINWSLGPSSIEVIPPVMQWFYENATANDYFYMGLSGPGYVHPYRDLLSKTPDPDKAWVQHLEIIQYYMDKLDLKHISLYTDAWGGYDRKKKDPVTLKYASSLDNLQTLILGMGRDEGITEYNYLLGNKNALVSHIATRWDPNQGWARSWKHKFNDVEVIQWLVDDIKEHTPEERPGFMHVMTISWLYYPSDIFEISKRLGDEYIAVSADDFKSLYLQSLSSNKDNRKNLSFH